jgi:hypothetical protein
MVMFSRLCDLRLAALLLLPSTLGGVKPAPVTHDDETTVIVGVVRTAVTRHPIANTLVFSDHSSTEGVRTDSAGRFVVEVSRRTTLLGVRKTGYQGFQYPVLALTTDTLFADIELRGDPISNESYLAASGNAPVRLPLLCVVADAPELLNVTNGCGESLHPAAQYREQIIKQHPGNLYFGPAGDWGVMLRRRTVSAR